MSNVAKLGEKDRFRFFRDAFSNISLIVGLAIVATLIAIVLFGSLIAPYNPYLVDRVAYVHFDTEIGEMIEVPVSPGADFVFGTDEIGQDILSLILHGARNTLIAAVLIATARVVIGLFVGLIAGWFEGRSFDRFVSFLTGVLTSLPILIGGFLIITVIGLAGGMWTFFIALTIIGWTEVAQYIRGEVLVARRMPYIEAARSIGLREIEIAIRHVLPNVMPQLFVISFLEIGAVLMLLGELALIGVFIGGAAILDFNDIGSSLIISIPSQPEWGAMIASGFRWFRSNPHIVLIPSAAVFIAVLGFNMVGEGLRGLFEKRGIKTSFLLSKRMLFLIASIFLAAFAIFQSTQPVRWFQSMAEDFNSQNVQMDREIIRTLPEHNNGWDRPIPITDYLATQFDDYGAKGGIRWSDYFDIRNFYLFEPAWTPLMEILSSDGNQIEQKFEYASDFGYIIDEYGGPGNVTLPLTLLHFYPDLRLNAHETLGRISFAGQVVMLEEGNAPPDVGQAVAESNASAIIWVAEEGASIQDARTKAILEAGDFEDPSGVPVFRITRKIADQILASGDLSFSALFPPEEIREDNSIRPIVETDIQVRMQLGLKNKKQIEINNMIAYYPGTDGDLGDEILTFVLPCDGLWRSDEEIEAPKAYQAKECSAPLVIEFMRLFDEFVFDMKRPAMVILWGGGEFSHLGLSEWLTDRDNFSHLSAPGMNLQPRVSIVLQIVDDPNSSEILIEDLSAENDLAALFSNAFDWAGVPFNQASGLAQIPLWVGSDILQYQANIAIDFSNPEFQEYGEGFSLALIRLMREKILNAD